MVKVKVNLEQAMKAQKGYSTTLSLLISALDECRWSSPLPGRHTPGKDLVHNVIKDVDINKLSYV
jgi:hypothetical protein